MQCLFSRVKLIGNYYKKKKNFWKLLHSSIRTLLAGLFTACKENMSYHMLVLRISRVSDGKIPFLSHNIQDTKGEQAPSEYSEECLFFSNDLASKHHEGTQVNRNRGQKESSKAT